MEEQLLQRRRFGLGPRQFQSAAAPQKLWLAAPDDFKPRGDFQTQLQPFGASFENEQLPLLDRKVKSE